MSLDDVQTHHIDIIDLMLFAMLTLSYWTLIFLVLSSMLKKYWAIGDILLFALMCSYKGLIIDQFLILTGMIGILYHLVSKRRIIPLVPVLSVAFYFSAV